MQLTAFLFGMSVLGAQIPLSTFARTDPDVAGFGLGADAAFVSTLIGVYVVFLAIGALTLPLTARLLGPRGALVVLARCWSRSATRCGCRSTTAPARRWSTWRSPASARAPWSPRCPAAAAAAAPPERTGFATGMTNATKTVGGAIASSIFAIALASTGSIDDLTEKGHASLGGLPHRLDRVRGRRPARRRVAPADAPRDAPSETVETVEAGTSPCLDRSP